MVDINVLIGNLNAVGMDKIKFYSDSEEGSSWLEFMKETLECTKEALRAIKLGIDLSAEQRYFSEFEREIQAARTNKEAFELAIEYAIMGFDFDSWMLRKKKSAGSRMYVKIEVFA